MTSNFSFVEQNNLTRVDFPAMWFTEAPLLVGLLANKDPSAKKYSEWTARACQADGLRYELRTVEDPIDVERALTDANADPRVHGIIVYYPILGQVESFSGESHDDFLRDSASYKRDVEGLCFTYRTNLYRNIRFLDYPANTQKCLLPCTALSVMKIIEQCPGCHDRNKPIGRHMEGKTVTVINRSEIVGRPLAAMISNDGADVYSIDINSIYLFSGGRLYKCENETTESCVRKVRERYPCANGYSCEWLFGARRVMDSKTFVFLLFFIVCCSASFLLTVISCHYWCPHQGLSVTDGMGPTKHNSDQCRKLQKR